MIQMGAKCTRRNNATEHVPSTVVEAEPIEQPAVPCVSTEPCVADPVSPPVVHIHIHIDSCTTNNSAEPSLPSPEPSGPSSGTPTSTAEAEDGKFCHLCTTDLRFYSIYRVPRSVCVGVIV